jgi:hypothetical protein
MALFCSQAFAQSGQLQNPCQNLNLSSSYCPFWTWIRLCFWAETQSVQTQQWHNWLLQRVHVLGFPSLAMNELSGTERQKNRILFILVVLEAP